MIHVGSRIRITHLDQEDWSLNVGDCGTVTGFRQLPEPQHFASQKQGKRYGNRMQIWTSWDSGQWLAILEGLDEYEEIGETKK